MAFKIPKIDFSDAKTRVAIIFGGLIGFVLIVYLGVKFFANTSSSSGQTKIASAPGDLQSVPGGQLTPEYYRAVVQASAQSAKQAQISGGSAVPTLLNEPGTGAFPAAPACTVVCPTDDTASVDNDINDLVKSGKLSAEEGNKLKDMAQNNVAVSEYSAALAQLVKEGKITPDQARKLLETYKKQHENALIAESGKEMDALIKSGKLSVDSANELLDLQKKHVSPEEYAAALNQMVADGKISPETAAQLLAQYSKQSARETAAENVGQLKSMGLAPDVAAELADYQKRGVSAKEYEEELQHLVKQGKLTPEQARRLLAQYSQQIPPDVAANLADMQRRNVPVAEYEAELKRLVDSGKLTPEQAQKLLNEYRALKGLPPSNTLEGVVRQAEQSNADFINSLALAAGDVKKLGGPADVAPAVKAELLALEKQDVPIEEYQKHLDELVRQGKLTPEQAAQLLQNYQKLKAVRAEAKKLGEMRAQRVTLKAYGDELKTAVAGEVFTASQATAILQEYSDSLNQPAAPIALSPDVKGSEGFAKLQQRVQASAPKPTVVPIEAPPARATSAAPAANNNAANKARDQAAELEKQHLQELLNAMSTQAGQLVTSWQPPSMAGINAAATDATTTKTTTKTTTSTAAATAAAAAGKTTAASVPALIKAGVILFAILETEVNSDYPDNPIMATIIDGKFKGAKILGKLALTPNQDRVTLTFKQMDVDEWPTGKTINAFAIDPDTARTALASNVNYHYFMRYGSLFASSFVSGYASAISNSGATTSSGIFGTTTTHPQLSPSQQIITGIGQVGTTFGTSIQSYVNTPPTVKIDAGVNLGILFMSDLTS